MKVKYVGPHSRYTVAGIAFTKGEGVELADSQIAQLKANGVGAKLFANGHLIADKVAAKPANKKVINPDLKPAPKAKAELKADAKTDK